MISTKCQPSSQQVSLVKHYIQRTPSTEVWTKFAPYFNLTGFHHILSPGILLFLTAILIDASLAQNTRQNPQEPKLGSKQGNLTCGTTDDLAMQVQTCAKPLMDILEGTIEKWPRNEKDAADLCNSVSSIYLIFSFVLDYYLNDKH